MIGTDDQRGWLVNLIQQHVSVSVLCVMQGPCQWSNPK